MLDQRVHSIFQKDQEALPYVLCSSKFYCLILFWVMENTEIRAFLALKIDRMFVYFESNKVKSVFSGWYFSRNCYGTQKSC